MRQQELYASDRLLPITEDPTHKSRTPSTRYSTRTFEARAATFAAPFRHRNDRQMECGGNMKTVSKRELNQQAAHVLDAVSVGQPIIVSERGVARWRIEAVESTADPIARQRAEGRIAPAKAKPALWPVAADARYSLARVDELFVESRGDR